jgi:DDE superfamily endonuclease/Helix-turn-helix of DDE superfamily endonuclease
VRQSTKTSFTTTRGFHAFLPCRAAAVAQDPHLRFRDHPPAPRLDRLALAETELRPEALLVLVYLRKGDTFAGVAAGFGVGTSTAWRYVNETVALLAARSPKLRKAVRDAKKAGHAYVVVDGTLIPVDRVAADRPFYSGKHRRHGMNLQVIASPVGDVLWVSGALPGSVHDKKAEWIWGVLAELEAAGLVTLADKGYQGSTYAKIPYKGKNKPESQKQANKAHAKLRSPGERANAQAQDMEDPQ